MLTLELQCNTLSKAGLTEVSSCLRRHHNLGSNGKKNEDEDRLSLRIVAERRASIASTEVGKASDLLISVTFGDQLEHSPLRQREVRLCFGSLLRSSEIKGLRAEVCRIREFERERIAALLHNTAVQDVCAGMLLKAIDGESQIDLQVRACLTRALRSMLDVFFESAVAIIRTGQGQAHYRVDFRARHRTGGWPPSGNR